jgi:putative addiction module component (TIGR02574 family)
MPLQDIEAQALQLPAEQRGRLVERLLQSLEPESQETPEAIAQAWDEEIARRLDDLEAGRTQPIPYDQVRTELRALIESHRRR